jgi:ribosome-associated protein
MAIEIQSGLSIDESEFEFRNSTSTGPGGQHVNRTETRVTLLFDVRSSRCLSDEQREKILARLASRINREGVMQVSSQKHRSQSANREVVMERFVELVAGALREDRARKPSRPTRASKKRRVDQKKQRGKTKQLRQKPGEE